MTSLTATPNSPTSVLLHWGSTYSCATYLLFRDGAKIATVANGQTLTVTDSGLTPVSSHSYTIQGVNADGIAGAVSTAVTGTTKALSASIPTNVAVSGSTASTVTLTWTASQDVTSYAINRNGTIVGTTTGATTYTDTGLHAGTTYQYIVIARNAAGVGNAAAAPVPGATQPPAPVTTTPDTTAPTVALIAPVSGTTVAGTRTVTVSAYDHTAVTRVELMVDGVVAATSTATPFSLAWDTTAVADGTHSLSALAYDAAGNTSVAATTMTVTVANAAVDAEDPPVAGYTRLALDDEFNNAANTGPDAGIWNIRTGFWGAGGHEDECYMNSANNVHQDGAGHLQIVALTAAGTNCAGTTVGHTSARLDTLGKFGFRYGRMAVRMAIPTQKGMWPAFWATNVDYTSGYSWPTSGEIDTLEATGTDTGTDRPVATLHAGSAANANCAVGTNTHIGSDLSGYHTYQTIWSPNQMIFQVDGATYLTVTPQDMASCLGTWPFNDHRFYPILNLAVGGVGSWPGVPDAATPATNTMNVDWVHVWTS